MENHKVMKCRGIKFYDVLINKHFKTIYHGKKRLFTSLCIDLQ